MTIKPSCVGQSVTCLTIDICMIADPGVVSSILAQCHTFAEIDHEIIFYGHSSPFPRIKNGCCQLQAKYWLTAKSSLPMNKVLLGELTVPT